MDCTKCGEDGMIREYKDGGVYGHSCDCGKYARVMEERYGGASIADLVNYLNYRKSYKMPNHD